MEELTISMNTLKWVGGGLFSTIGALIWLLGKVAINNIKASIREVHTTIEVLEEKMNSGFEKLEEDMDEKLEILSKELDYRDLQFRNEMLKAGLMVESTPPKSSTSN